MIHHVIVAHRLRAEFSTGSASVEFVKTQPIGDDV